MEYDTDATEGSATGLNYMDYIEVKVEPLDEDYSPQVNVEPMNEMNTMTNLKVKKEADINDMDFTHQSKVDSVDEVNTMTNIKSEKEPHSALDELTAEIFLKHYGLMHKKPLTKDKITDISENDNTKETSSNVDDEAVRIFRSAGYGYIDGKLAVMKKEDEENISQSEKTDDEVDLEENEIDNLTPVANPNDTLITCYICNESFTDLISLRNHRTIHRKGNYLRCDKCKFSCITQRRLDFHKLDHETVGVYRCEKCDKCFPTSSHLYRHDSNVHIGLRPYGCPACEYRTYSLQSLQRHELRHKLTCPVCNEQFTLYKDLNKHITEQHLPKPHKCSECDAAFPIRSQLMVHMSIHATKAGIQSFHCSLCDTGYASEFRLRQHVYRLHTTDKKFECGTCGERFPHKYLLTRHEVRHSDDLKLSCEICGKKYARRDSLKAHMASHSNKTFPCSVCGLEYFTERMLNNHIDRKHADSIETNFECSTCGKAFGKKWLLKEHMAIHSNVQKFSCQICAKSFKHEKSLKDHEGTHSDSISLDFDCEQCDKKFRTKRNLREHMNNIHAPEDKRRNRLEKRAMQERARQEIKRKNKAKKMSGENSSEEQLGEDAESFEGNGAVGMNSLISEQMKESGVQLDDENQTVTSVKNVSIPNAVSEDEGVEVTQNPIKGYIIVQEDPHKNNEVIDFKNVDIINGPDALDVEDHYDNHNMSDNAGDFKV